MGVLRRAALPRLTMERDIGSARPGLRDPVYATRSARRGLRDPVGISATNSPRGWYAAAGP